MLSKNQLHDVTIEDYNSDGFGVARILGQVVFVAQALLGETCRIRILKTAKTHAFAKVEEVISPSPERQAPPCKAFGPCGGCDLLHMSYAEELRLKEMRVQSAVSRIAGINCPVSPVLPAENRFHYRNKAMFAISEKGLGFYRKRSHNVVPIDACLIQSSIANRALTVIHSWMHHFQVPAYTEANHSGILRHLFVRTAQKDSHATVCLVVKEDNFAGQEALIQDLQTHCPEISGISLCINADITNVVLRGTFRTLWGQDFLEERLCGLEFQLSPKSFFQINPTQAEVLYETALSFAALTGEETVLDLYCGTGTITQILAKQAKLAIGCEIVASAVSDAKENAKRNHISNTEFILGDVSKLMKTLQERKLSIDVVVLDPPRKGLDASVITEIAEISPKRVVYVSCDPGTLARDLDRFQKIGYQTTQIQPVDMFPCTTHVECVVLMTRVEML